MKPWIAAAMVLALGVPLSAQAVTSQHQGGKENPVTNETVFPASMAGRWTAMPLEVKLSSDFHRSIYGPDARSVRMVNVTLDPSGGGTFTVTSSVRDRQGRTVPGTREIDDVRFTMGELAHEIGYQPHYTTHIAKAERRYPDDPSSTFTLDGVKLEFFVPEGKADTMDVRFDTPDGRGSFWETLRRAPRAAKQPS